jgi:hypothetical protein
MSLARILLMEIELFLAKSGMAETAFGLAVKNDGKFVPQLRSGRIPSADTIDAVYAYIRRNTQSKKRRRRAKA